MDKKVFLNSEGVQQFSNALDLLNQSINEFNQVADKIVPEKLLTDGIISYLRHFCELLQKETNVTFVFSGPNEILEAGEDTEVSLFRCVRAMLMLIVRQSNTTRVMVDVVKKRDFFLLTIQGNGTNIFHQPSKALQYETEKIAAILTLAGGIMNIARENAINVRIEMPLSF